MQGCASYKYRLISNTDVTAANWEFTSLYGSVGEPWPEGAAMYWYMAGPGADPEYNPSTYTLAEATAWGKEQAEAANSWWLAHGPGITSGVVFMDIEDGYTADGVNYANGWNEWVYSSGTDCGEIISSEDIPPAIDRGVVNGFGTCIDGQTLTSAVYSSPDYWAETFGTCSSSNRPACLTETPEWTSEGDSGCALPGPHGWAQAAGVCGAESGTFFGDVGSTYQLGWQWCEASSLDDYCNLNNQQDADFDQSDASNWPLG